MRQLPILIDVIRLEHAGILPAFLLNEWLSINAPTFKLDTDELLISLSCDLGVDLGSYRRNEIDALPSWVRSPKLYSVGLVWADSHECYAFIEDALRMRYDMSPTNKEVKTRYKKYKGEPINKDYQYVRYIQGEGAIHPNLVITGNGGNVEGERLTLTARAAVPRPSVVWNQPPVIYKRGNVTTHIFRRDNNLYPFVQIEQSGSNVQRIHYKSLDDVFDFANLMNQKRNNVYVSNFVFNAINNDKFKGTEFVVNGQTMGRRGIMNLILRLFPVGTWATIVVGAMILAMGNPYALKMLEYLEEIKIWEYNNVGILKVFGAIGDTLRRVRMWPNGRPATMEECLVCSYWQTFCGRMPIPVDWEAEKAKRINKPSEKFVPIYQDSFLEVTGRDEVLYEKYARSALQPMWDELHKVQVVDMSWADAVQARYNWKTQGSDNSKRIFIEGVRAKSQTKAATLENYSSAEMLEWLLTQPLEVAVATLKDELGKARALYASDMKHYLISCYAATGIETNMHKLEYFEKGYKGETASKTVSWRYGLAYKQHKHSQECIDYKDFNAQHTAYDQWLLYDEQVLSAKRHDSHPDAIKAMEWHRDSNLNKWIKFGPEITLKVLNGMNSGTRNTDATNSFLNALYWRVAKLGLLHLFPWLKEYVTNDTIYSPKDEGTFYKTFQGDDVMMGGDILLNAFMHQHMNNSGLIFQTKKQFEGEYSEYLRNIYSPNGVYGFLARAVGAYMTSPFKSEDVTDPQERLLATRSHLTVANCRGLSEAMCSMLYDMEINKQRKVKSSKYDKSRVTVPLSIVEKPKFNGGWGASNSFNRRVRVTNTGPSLKKWNHDYSGVDTNLQMLATKDRVSLISAEVREPWRTKAFISAKRTDVIHSLLDSDTRKRDFEGLKSYYRHIIGCFVDQPFKDVRDRSKIIKRLDDLSNQIGPGHQVRYEPSIEGKRHVIHSTYSSINGLHCHFSAFGIHRTAKDTSLGGVFSYLIARDDQIAIQIQRNLPVVDRANERFILNKHRFLSWGVDNENSEFLSLLLVCLDSLNFNRNYGGYQVRYLDDITLGLNTLAFAHAIESIDIDIFPSRFTTKAYESHSFKHNKRSIFFQDYAFVQDRLKDWVLLACLTETITELEGRQMLMATKKYPILEMYFMSIILLYIGISDPIPPNSDPAYGILLLFQEIIINAVTTTRAVNPCLATFVTDLIFRSADDSRPDKHLTDVNCVQSSHLDVSSNFSWSSYLFGLDYDGHEETQCVTFRALVDRAVAGSSFQSVADTKRALNCNLFDAFSFCFSHTKVTSSEVDTCREMICRIHEADPNGAYLLLATKGGHFDTSIHSKYLTPALISEVEESVHSRTFSRCFAHGKFNPVSSCGCDLETRLWCNTQRVLMVTIAYNPAVRMSRL